jgi:hypothetical protein
MQMVTVAPIERTWSPATVLNPGFCIQHNYSNLLCIYIVPPHVVQSADCVSSVVQTTAPSSIFGLVIPKTVVQFIVLNKILVF